jgi:putative restriction endonuclease
MTKAVFTTKVMPGYKDLPEARYHFPRTYLNQVRQTVGDHIVYYEPRRSSVDLSSIGGRQSYFGIARVVDVVEDRELADHYYALVDDYLDFDRAVPFAEGSEYYETALKKADGSTNRGAFGRAVRNIPDDEFDRILKAGFAPVLGQSDGAQKVNAPGLAEPQILFERPIVEMTVSRPFRERSFMFNVREAYSNRCAMTGLRLINPKFAPTGGRKARLHARLGAKTLVVCVHVRDSQIGRDVIRFGNVHRDGAEPRLAARGAVARELSRRARPRAEADLGESEQAAAGCD